LAQAGRTSRDNVARLEISYFRAENVVEAPPAPSHWNVSRHPESYTAKNRLNSIKTRLSGKGRLLEKE